MRILRTLVRLLARLLPGGAGGGSGKGGGGAPEGDAAPPSFDADLPDPPAWEAPMADVPDFPDPPGGDEPKVGITDRAVAHVARDLGTEPAVVLAVDEVESRGSGFLPDGRPRILYEAHVFGRLTGHVWTDSHPTLSSRGWDRSLYEGGAAEHRRLRRAAELDWRAAHEACSWGRFQIMGFNWEAAGYASLWAFVRGMQRSESEHLRAFAAFVRSEGLDGYLRERDWAAFAAGYNGPGYRENKYDERLREAYERRLL